tara:strand:- start:1078 stop:1200 length:123 start_codon:yes stop_codon:yes gene_type:complete
MVQGVRFELTNPSRPDLKPGAFDQLGNPCVKLPARLGINE